MHKYTTTAACSGAGPSSRATSLPAYVCGHANMLLCLQHKTCSLKLAEMLPSAISTPKGIPVTRSANKQTGQALLAQPNHHWPGYRRLLSPATPAQIVWPSRHFPLAKVMVAIQLRASSTTTSLQGVFGCQCQSAGTLKSERAEPTKQPKSCLAHRQAAAQ